MVIYTIFLWNQSIPHLSNPKQNPLIHQISLSFMKSVNNQILTQLEAMDLQMLQVTDSTLLSPTNIST